MTLQLHVESLTLPVTKLSARPVCYIHLVYCWSVCSVSSIPNTLSSRLDHHILSYLFSCVVASYFFRILYKHAGLWPFSSWACLADQLPLDFTYLSSLSSHKSATICSLLTTSYLLVLPSLHSVYFQLSVSVIYCPNKLQQSCQHALAMMLL